MSSNMEAPQNVLSKQLAQLQRV